MPSKQTTPPSRRPKFVGSELLSRQSPAQADARAKNSKRPKTTARPYPAYDDVWRPEDAIVREGPDVLQPSRLAYRDDARGLWLYHGDCLEVMDHLLERHPQGVFDLIFADPPYFLLSQTCGIQQTDASITSISWMLVFRYWIASTEMLTR